MLHQPTKDFIDHYKGPLSGVLTDLRDAKRRISLVKGPKGRKANQPLPEAEGNDEATSEGPQDDDDDD